MASPWRCGSAPTGAKRYSLQAETHNASLTGTVNPVAGPPAIAREAPHARR